MSFVVHMQVAYANGQLYIVRTELARIVTTVSGLLGVELNSIYWARVDPNNATSDANFLCTSNVEMQARGMIVSGNQLHLSYPSVSVTANGAAYIIYSYAGSEVLADFTRAFPGGLGDGQGRAMGLEVVCARVRVEGWRSIVLLNSSQKVGCLPLQRPIGSNGRQGDEPQQEGHNDSIHKQERMRSLQTKQNCEISVHSRVERHRCFYLSHILFGRYDSMSGNIGKAVGAALARCMQGTSAGVVIQY